jgi:cysteine-rich repeat protein
MDFYDDQAAMPTPTRIEGLPPSEALFVGSEHACSLSQGEVWCWGGNVAGQAVPGEGMVLTQATRLPTELRFRELALSWSHSCGITEEGALYCWGDNSSGQLGREPIDEHGVAQVPGLEALRSVLARGYHSCARAEDGRLYCLGDNSHGVFGSGDFSSSWQPRESVLSGAEALASGDYAMYALLSDGHVMSWGWKALGDGVGGLRSKPVQVAGLEEVQSIAGGNMHACALTKAGEVWCWGSNEYGILGMTPVQRRVEVTGLASRGCGDALVHSGEGCDDGNREAGDGCDSDCQVEEGWRCERTRGCLRLRAGDSCEQAIALSFPSELEGSFEGFGNDYNPSYGGCTQGHWATGAEVVFRLEVQAGASLRVSAQSELDVVLYVSTGCPDVLGPCILGSDEGVAGELEQLTLHNELPEAQTYYLVVDSYVWASEPHGFWLQVEEVEE